MATKYDFKVTLDRQDFRHVNQAMGARRTFLGGCPDGDSCEEGALLGEICRGWMEQHGIEIQSDPGDGGAVSGLIDAAKELLRTLEDGGEDSGVPGRLSALRDAIDRVESCAGA